MFYDDRMRKREKREAEATRLGAIARDTAEEEMRVWTRDYLGELALKHNMDILQKCGNLTDETIAEIENKISICRALNREPRNNADRERARYMRQAFWNNEHEKPFSRVMPEGSVMTILGILRKYAIEEMTYESEETILHEILYPNYDKSLSAEGKRQLEELKHRPAIQRYLEGQKLREKEIRKEKKIQEDEDEDSVLKHKLRLSEAELRASKFRVLLKDAEDIYRGAKSAEDKEEAERRLVNIKMSLDEAELLCKKRAKELKEKRGNGD